jgi:hypothetical protein
MQRRCSAVRWKQWCSRTSLTTRRALEGVAGSLQLLTLPQSSLDALTRWFASASATALSSAEVRLLVAHPAGSGESPVELESRAARWAVEHGFEHVSPGSAEQGEACGVARVIEALQAHTWPGLVAKPRSAPGAAAPAAAELAAEPQEEDDFDALLGEMLQAREAAASGGRGDDERRATAARLATRMAALMGEGSESEEETE